MPFVTKERIRPQPWRDYRTKAFHAVFVPFVFVDWLSDWGAFFLSGWKLLEVLEYAGSFSVLIAVIFYFAEAGDRAKARHYQAWQVINTAQGKGGSGGRIDALTELNQDHVPLVGVDVSSAFLQGVNLEGADLHRGNFAGADLRDSRLAKTNLQFANLIAANLRKADMREVDLSDAEIHDADLNGVDLGGADLARANLDRADLRGVDLANVQHWRDVVQFNGANILGVRNAPGGFVDWAVAHEAVQIESDEKWNELLNPPATQPSK